MCMKCFVSETECIGDFGGIIVYLEQQIDHKLVFIH